MKRALARSLITVAAILWSIVPTGPAVASGSSTLVVDKSSYQRGDQIRICWLLPAAGTSKLTDTDANGSSQVLRTGTDNGSGCVTGNIGASVPLGRACELLDFDTSRGPGSVQTCFQVTEAAAEEHVVAEHAELSFGAVSGPDDTDIAVEGVGFQTFSYAAHGVTIFVKGPANYAPGDYAVNARYTFVNAVSGRVSATNTQYLTDGVSFSVE